MKKGSYIIYIAMPVVAALLCLLGWNSYTLYNFEKNQARERVEFCIAEAADVVQQYNGSLLDNYATMLTDKDYGRKVAFAAGFTHNLGKISVSFDAGVAAGSDDTEPAVPEQHDTIPHFTADYFKEHGITYKPDKAMSIHHFDSILKIEFFRKKINVPYTIVVSSRDDTSHLDTIVSAPFILQFTQPKIYALRYNIPPATILQSMLPYLLSVFTMCLLLISGVTYAYRSYKTQAQLSQFRESLLGNITHELKTPLSSLQLIIDKACNDISPSGEALLSAEHIWYAATELNRMKLLIDRMLSFSKMNKEQFALNKQLVDVAKVVNDAIDVMEINIKRKGGTVTTSLLPDAMILGDQMLLANVIAAIIDNSLKYSIHTPEVHISITREGQQIIIAIQDNGIGLAKQYYEKVFDAFFRVPTGNVQNASGHGLGLSFAKQVVTLHGGSIYCTSNENGTTFYIKLHTS